MLRTIGFTLMVRIDSVKGLENVPSEGPAILMMNHIAFVDPIVLVHVTPRDIVPLAKTEAYHYPFVGVFPRIWGVIPVERQGIDRRAVQKALAVLSSGEILLVAPEGTRQDALTGPKEGAAYLASRSGAPIVPVALENTRGFPSHPFSQQWRRPGADVRYGRPFRVREDHRRARGPVLARILDEAMYVLAGMLPENRRGEYADLGRATMDTIEWL
ncbi:MAG TPA: lysophospholipid acyltransferase family protein [Anaerolineales bacterium]|nr:lysophospholipid acyltransferase family protein [Anaerolineales bacterium]